MRLSICTDVMGDLSFTETGDSVPDWLVYTKSWPDEMPERAISGKTAAFPTGTAS